jgi:hypothetical protein
MRGVAGPSQPKPCRNASIKRRRRGRRGGHEELYSVNFLRLLCVGGNAKRTEHSAKHKAIELFSHWVSLLVFLALCLLLLLHAIL